MNRIDPVRSHALHVAALGLAGAAAVLMAGGWNWLDAMLAAAMAGAGIAVAMTEQHVIHEGGKATQRTDSEVTFF